MNDALLTLLIRGELALTVGVLLALVLRRPVRRALGPLAAYALWLVAPLCVIAALLPAAAPTGAMAPVVTLAADAAWSVRPVSRQVHKVSEILTALWVLGALGAASLFALRQARFVRSLGRLAPSPTDRALLLGQHTGAGPMLLGALRPRIVAPADFEARFQGSARELVLAHERVHLARGDAAVNALVVVVRCLAWFNPLVHHAARALRIDQEIACDAAVVERHPDAARLYAETLLGSALTPMSAPFGCHWPAVGAHPLKERLTMLQTASTSPARKTLGALLVGTLALAAAGAVWAANAPPEPTVRNPLWVQRPGLEDMTRYYPEIAHEAGVTAARVTVDCSITAEGRLENCLVRQEDPAQYGFGEATIKLVRHFQMAPEDRDGKPTVGGVIRIPIVFQDPKA
ncbi:TonB family protein [Caulobacter sp.]|uniref:TonB family protein n=1 Tax=Caulobacter sp. TaxID=78 RepID=UPI001B13FF32|nr:TonB family protein [Caulobacter sp.]MBO9543744.1 TonB family protein [Caulobacter sp.]